jgi:AraC family transcriptional regulator of adaptative response / DNA-3-methyladenine glycosylase II
MLLDREICYRALQTRDVRFDGRIFTAVKTTGIYCRPICPARTPKLENVVFLPTAAACQQAGYRPCLRCRPEASPQLAAWRGTSSTVSRALALIAEGALDGPGASVDSLAARLGIGERQLRRLFEKHLGASPIAAAQTKRVHFARQLLVETDLGMVDVALAAGFGSLRRFNETFRRLYGRPPSVMRRQRQQGAEGSGLTLTLSYVPPYDWPAMSAYLAAQALPGVEVVLPGRYLRTVWLDGQQGTIEVAPVPSRHALAATIRFPCVRALPSIVGRIRRMFDLHADLVAINAHLASDPHLAPLLEARPGLRLPGAWDPFELTLRAALAQHLPAQTARAVAGRLAATWGEPLRDPPHEGLTTVFPAPERLLGQDLASVGVPRALAATLTGLVEAMVHDPSSLPPLGEELAQYVALRGWGEPDAFPVTDPALDRERTEAWRPWRGYAALHLWTAA